jgi:hypothetical protein
MAAGRTAEGPHMELSTLDPRLRDIVGTAARNFEEAHPGYRVEAFSGRRHGAGQGPHASATGALDMQIVGPQGVITSRGTDPTGLYRELAQHARGVQLTKYKNLSGQFNWGGAFETSKGSGTPDLMHFDLSGVRGRYRQNLITGLEPRYRQAQQVARQQEEPQAPGKLATDTRVAADVARRAIDEKSKRSVKVEGSGKVDIKIAEAPPPKMEVEKHFFKPNPVEHKTQMEPAKTGPETHPTPAPARGASPL